MDSIFDPPTPPMRRPKATPKKAKTPANKNNNFSAAAFAKMVLVNQQEIDQLKPLPRSHVEHSMEDDSDQDVLVFGDDGDDISLPDTNDVAPPRSPNYNPDLSDDDMSRSPSPFNPANVELSLPEATRYATQRLNVPSAAPEAYFQKNVPRINELYVNKPTENGQRVKIKLPIAYWKWPTRADEHQAEQDRKARTRENYVPTPFNPVVRTLNDAEIKITIQPTARPPHINWIIRKQEAEQETKDKAAAAVALALKLKKEREELRKKMLLNKDAAKAAVLASIQLDEDGFFKIKGTRKRRGPGIDLEEGRKRRKYTWKAGPPLRGKALKEAREKAQQEAERLMKIHQERIDRGEDITDSNTSDSSDEEDDEEDEKEAQVAAKVVKNVAKAGKTAITTRKSAAPKKPRAPRKPAALKKIPAKKSPTVASDDSENDSPPTPAAKKAPTKRVAASKKTPASAKRVLVESSGDAAPTTADRNTPAARKVVTTKKTPAPEKNLGPKKTSSIKKTPAPKKSAEKIIESDVSDEHIDERPTPPAKKTSTVEKNTTIQKTPVNLSTTKKAPVPTSAANNEAVDATPAAKKITAPEKKAPKPRNLADYGDFLDLE